MTEEKQSEVSISTPNFIGMLLEAQQDALNTIADSDKTVDVLKLELLGTKSELSKLTEKIVLVPKEERQQVGIVVTDVKQSIENALSKKRNSDSEKQGMSKQFMDL